MQPAWKKRNSNEQYCLHIQREKLTFFFEKKKTQPTQNIVPHLMFIKWNFIEYFLIEHSLIGIIKPKFTRGNEL